MLITTYKAKYNNHRQNSFRNDMLKKALINRKLASTRMCKKKMVIHKEVHLKISKCFYNVITSNIH